MSTVVSKDGTPIAYTRTGSGAPVILVDGALCYRASGPSGPLAALLAPHFTVFTYDRRGRGESGDRAPYAIEREVEDIVALIGEAGGSAYLYGISSGAVLSLEAGNRLPSVRKLALYEAPFIVDGSHPPLPAGYLDRLKSFIASGKPSDAVKLFLRTVGVPSPFVMIMPLLPVWSKLKGVAHTLVYDITLVKDYQTGKPLPAGAWPNISVPVLTADGAKSPAWMRNGMRALAKALPHAEYRTLPGQTHMLKAQAIAPVLVEFFNR